MKEKKKILILSDNPLVPSGVGTQTKYMIEALLDTGQYQFFCLAGAIKHNDYSLQTVQPYGEDWLIKPVNGYGNPEIIRSILRDYKPDVIWFMTDPRFYTWLWDIENEIRPSVPMVYYHVWDNYPYPTFNKKFYNSNDVVCTISKVTDDIVKTVAPETTSVWIPHTVDHEVFKKQKPENRAKVRKEITNTTSEKMIFFWNNRNARRKQSGTLIYWFKAFLDKVGHDKACLVMHTEPKDQNGQDLEKILENLNLVQGEVLLSTVKIPPKELAEIYSAADCTINISDAEGFGLSTLESLACETPIIVNMTGGLQEQVTDGKNWFGIGIEPISKCVIGSQDVPWIYEDRINKEQFMKAMLEFYNTPEDEREKLGAMGRKHVLDNYNISSYASKWRTLFEYITNELGSWDTRKNYKSWNFEEIK
jgi:glycosyltransferase involved in cell wall biosynthesis